MSTTALSRAYQADVASINTTALQIVLADCDRRTNRLQVPPAIQLKICAAKASGATVIQECAIPIIRLRPGALSNLRPGMSVAEAPCHQDPALQTLNSIALGLMNRLAQDNLGELRFAWHVDVRDAERIRTLSLTDILRLSQQRADLFVLWEPRWSVWENLLVGERFEQARDPRHSRGVTLAREYALMACCNHSLSLAAG